MPAGPEGVDVTEIRRRTTCAVPGHGTRCEVAQEKPTRFVRGRTERMALQFEETASGVAVMGASGELERALDRERERETAAQRQRVLQRMVMQALFGGAGD